MTSAARAAVAKPEAAVTPWYRNKGRWIVGAVVVVVLLVFGLPRLLATLEYFHVQTVQLEGARYLAPSAVVSALGADTSASVFDDPAGFVKKVETIPLVARATVRRRLPGTLLVTISERVPVALVATRDGFRGVDSLGNRLPIDPAVAAFDAPVVLPAAGARDSNADRRVFALLAQMRSRNPAMFEAIEDIRRVSATEWQLHTSRQLVRVSPEVTLERLADIFPVERALAKRHLRAAELDLRYNNHVIARLP